MRASQGFGAFLLAATALSAPLHAQPKRFGELHRMLPSRSGWDVGFGDFDGDGDLDALLAGNGDSWIHFNDGSGAFTEAASPLPPAPTADLAVAIGDVDGDGDLDLVLGCGQANLPAGAPDSLLLNDGSGAFTDASAQLPAILDSTAAVALGDLDGDGDLDALMGNATTSSSSLPIQDRLYLNVGAGVFADASAQLPGILDSTAAVALGDLDGDGDLDALMGNAEISFALPPVQDRLYLNDGSGVFTDASAQLPAILDFTLDVALGDIDADGDLDALLASGYVVQPDRLYLNDGSAVFTDASAQLPVGSVAMFAVALGDVDADGDLDGLVAGDWFDSLWLNDGTGAFSDASAQLPANLGPTFDVALGDVDADGDLDALMGNLGSSDLYLNDGTGAFADAAPQLPAFVAETGSVALGDVDQDGDADALIADFPQERLYLNDGAGSFADATAQLPAGTFGAEVAVLADVDGDGDLDALVGSPGRLQLNDGSGNFADASSQLPPSFGFTSVALGDLDGDLDADAMVANLASCGYVGCSPGLRRLYLNSGSGNFADAPAQIPATSSSGFTAAVAMGDLDADGDLDALFGESGDPSLPGGSPWTQNRLWLNDGFAVFTDATGQLPAFGGATRAVALGDVEGDGDLDALLGTAGSSARLWLNDGAAGFSDAPTQVPAFADDTTAVALADVDGDADLDALVGNTGPDRLFLNDGSGTFTDATADLPSIAAGSRAIAVADLDGDGDLDVLTGNWPARDRVLSNLTRQLAWRGLPRIGKPFTLDVYGPSSGGWTLGFALGSASIPVAPYGVLRLDPATLSFVGVGPLDAQGRGAITFAVPALPSLVGIPVYWQAIVALPLRLTNLERTSLTVF